MPLFEHPMLGPFGGDSQTIKLARKADSEVADIDHLLHFAFTFSEDLARFERHKPAKILLRIAQGIAKLADQFTSLRRWNCPPLEKCVLGTLHGALILIRCGHPNCGKDLAINRRDSFKKLATAHPFAAKRSGIIAF